VTINIFKQNGIALIFMNVYLNPLQYQSYLDQNKTDASKEVICGGVMRKMTD
jgi:hypothetical protein